MPRHHDTKRTNTKLPNLESISWSSIGRQAPKLLKGTGVSAAEIDSASASASALKTLLDKIKNEPLPSADQVIMVWTSAEWAALDHVFCNSDSERAPYRQKGYSDKWRKDWFAYNRGANAYYFGHDEPKIWGYYRRVQITTDHKLADGSAETRTVLLYKSNTHLDSNPYLPGLEINVSNLLTDTAARRIYSTGTAGGSRLDEKLGNAIITNAAHIQLTLAENSIANYNNKTFTCTESFPDATKKLTSAIEKHLMVSLGKIVHKDNSGNTKDDTENLQNLFDISMAEARKKTTLKWELEALDKIKLSDMLNSAIDPTELGEPLVQSLPDVPLLTTDFYYIGKGEDTYGYAFLEMDDAVVAHQAEAAGIQYAFIRNISDPIVPYQTADKDTAIPFALRKAWSGNIYSNYGIYTSVNSALTAWSTIAGDTAALTPGYNPKRQLEPCNIDAPLEVSLVFNVRACGTCDFFWPAFPKDQPYGPYSAYNTSLDALPDKVPSDQKGAKTQPWQGKSVSPSFPNPEILDGCRKAPIMTIGINPNLTAFLPGRAGAPWVYPKFETDEGGNAYEKFARYYRYRSVNQESLAFSIAEKNILPQGQIIAEEDGKLVTADRYSSNPSWSIGVQYVTEPNKTKYYDLKDQLGEAPYVLLFDYYGEESKFKKGDVIAGKIHVPGGENHDIYPKRQTYYGQFVPSLNDFQAFLRKESRDSSINLMMGEDVCQLDMVACASPHWKSSYLGGSQASENTIINDCVRVNAWAIKQLVQTKPAILFLVGETSWDMFHDNFSALLSRQIFNNGSPPDGPFSLFSVTKDSDDPLWLEFKCSVQGTSYSLKTRIVVTPHFSFSDNFEMQYRVSPSDWAEIQKDQPAVADYLTDSKKNEHAISYTAPEYAGDYAQFIIAEGKKHQIDDAIKALAGGSAALGVLQAGYYNAHAGMANVLQDMYKADQLSLSKDAQGNYLSRNQGPCTFCDNDYWEFPLGCPYGKPEEKALPVGFLDAVAAALIAKARPIGQESRSSVKSPG